MSASGKYGPARCCAGIIGNVDLRIGSRAKGILEQHVVVSGGRFKGIRNGATWHEDPSLSIYCSGAPQGLYRDGNFREGFAGLASLGLAFDAWLFHTQLSDVADLARAFPQATIVLNHVGGALAIGPYAGKGEEAFAEWRDGVRQVASFPNTYVKLGGLGMKLTGFTFFENDMPPSSEDLEKAWRPYIETCVSAFGPQRGKRQVVQDPVRDHDDVANADRRLQGLPELLVKRPGALLPGSGRGLLQRATKPLHRFA